MATIKEVASLAGVSVATVSRVLNSPECVSKDNREHVEKAIAELSYIPNFLGKNLRQQRTKRIIVVLNNIINPFFSRIIEGIEDTAKQEGYTILICATRDDKDNILNYMSMLSTKVADGAIFLSPELVNDEILRLSEINPIVCACEPLRSKKVTSVTVDDEKASFDATSFLINSGKRDIVLISAGNTSYSSILREQGFKRALAENNIPYNDDMIIPEGYAYTAGKNAAKKLLLRKKLPSAIFALADTSAIGAMKTLSAAGVKIPDDLSIMGFDNTAFSEMFIPSLTTVSQPQYQMGKLSMELLLKKIKGKKIEYKKIVEHEIILRQSVK